MAPNCSAFASFHIAKQDVQRTRKTTPYAYGLLYMPRVYELDMSNGGSCAQAPPTSRIRCRPAHRAMSRTAGSPPRDAGTRVRAVAKIEAGRSPEPGFLLVARLATALRPRMSGRQRTVFDAALAELVGLGDVH